MSAKQLSQLHHFSLKGRDVSFGEGYRYFAVNKNVKGNNARYAERLNFVASEYKRGKEPLSTLIQQALSKWPLRGGK
jgi:hypothetical protein